MQAQTGIHTFASKHYSVEERWHTAPDMAEHQRLLPQCTNRKHHTHVNNTSYYCLACIRHVCDTRQWLICKLLTPPPPLATEPSRRLLHLFGTVCRSQYGHRRHCKFFAADRRPSFLPGRTAAVTKSVSLHWLPRDFTVILTCYVSLQS